MYLTLIFLNVVHTPSVSQLPGVFMKNRLKPESLEVPLKPESLEVGFNFLMLLTHDLS